MMWEMMLNFRCDILVFIIRAWGATLSNAIKLRYFYPFRHKRRATVDNRRDVGF